MKKLPGLTLLFVFILVVMLAATGYATSFESVIAGGRKIFAEPWALATLADAYCGFLTFYAWVFYKERGLGARVLWLIAILGLGNIAMALYVLWQIRKLRAGEGAAELLTHQSGA